MQRISIGLSLAMTISLVAVAGAAAQDNSALDEYTESVPTAGGEVPSSDQTGGGGGGADQGGDASSLAPGVVDELNASGVDGEAAASLAQQTAPGNSSENGVDSANGDAAGRSSPDGSQSDTGGGIGGVVDQVVGTSDSGGMGIALPIILGAALVAAFLFLLARRRGPGEHDSA